MQTKPNINKLPNYDLASAVNAVVELYGTEEDDCFTWTRQVNATIKIFQLDDISQMKLIISRLRGKAAEWLTALLSKYAYLTAEEILERMKKQFSNTNVNHKKLNQFLFISCVKNKIEYENLLNLANDVFQRKAINEESLIKLTITRCPAMLRPILLYFTNNDGEWYNFVKEAKQNSWVAFAEDDAYIKEQTIANDHVFKIKK
ncbi:hypothetical protein COBT_000397, partial [Conglomerata obtusa]